MRWRRNGCHHDYDYVLCQVRVQQNGNARLTTPSRDGLESGTGRSRRRQADGEATLATRCNVVNETMPAKFTAALGQPCRLNRAAILDWVKASRRPLCHGPAASRVMPMNRCSRRRLSRVLPGHALLQGGALRWCCRSSTSCPGQCRR